jgi:hypothetical protein
MYSHLPVQYIGNIIRPRVALAKTGTQYWGNKTGSLKSWAWARRLAGFLHRGKKGRECTVLPRGGRVRKHAQGKTVGGGGGASSNTRNPIPIPNCGWGFYIPVSTCSGGKTSRTSRVYVGLICSSIRTPPDMCIHCQHET